MKPFPEKKRIPVRSLLCRKGWLNTGEDNMTEEEILKLKSEMFKKDVKLLQFKSTFSILNMEFLNLYIDKDKISMVNELKGKFELLIENLLEIEED